LRARSRAWVTTHSLNERIKTSGNVLILKRNVPATHVSESRIGITTEVESNNNDGYMACEHDDIDTGVFRLVDAIKKDENLSAHFIDPEEAEDIITKRSLVVIVDTNKPSMVADEELLNKAEYKVVIDHHRRGEDFIQNPTLVY